MIDRTYRGDDRLSGGPDPGIERRILVIASLIGVFFAILLLRLFQLQIVQGADLSDRSRRNSVRHVRLEAPRGEIVDREGRVLATTRPAFRVEVVPSEVRSPEPLYRALGTLLGRDPVALRERVGMPRGRDRFKPVVLNSDLTYDQHARLESHRYALPGVMTATGPRREYVEDSLAAHLLGVVGEVQARQLEELEGSGYRQGDVIGQAGLESRFESHLRGRSGGRNLVVDVLGREMEVIDEVDPEPGGRIVLTIDADLQRVGEEVFQSADPDGEGYSGALVAMDPRNGDILAMVSQPAYDPNAFAGGIDAEAWKSLMQDPLRPMQNRALAGQYSPGSTYKALVAVAGLAEDDFDPEETVFCPGHFTLGRRTYRCWKRGGHGDVNLEQALVQSCDVYFYKLGLKLGIDKIGEFATAFGLGSPTGIEIAGEKAGLVPTRGWKERAKRERWLRGETVSAAIGQGFNLMTPLQLALAFSVIANGGTRVTPRLVMRLETWDGKLVELLAPHAGVDSGIDPEDLELVRNALVEVVQAEGGTGARARVRGVRVGGKTGTTQVVSLKVVEGMEKDEIPLRFRDHALFVAFAPAESPEIVVAVVVEHGRSGAGVAAPMVQKVLARYFEKKQEAKEALFAAD